MGGDQQPPWAGPFPVTATENDIRYCFRLLLGRLPHREEWPGHSSLVGHDLYNVVRHYVTSREFAARGMLSQSYLDAVELLHLAKFDLFVARDDLAVSAALRQNGVYEPHVTAALERHVRPGMFVVDIGANIGYLTMYLATLVGASGRVVAVEPNPENVALIEASRRVNRFDQVSILQCAAGSENGVLALNVMYCNGMTGNLPEDVGMLLGSRTVACFALDTVLPGAGPVAFIKIDVEGAELQALRGFEQTIDRDRPVIVSEFSPGMMQGTSGSPALEYLGFLIAKNYDVQVIAADGTEIPCGRDPAAVIAAYRAGGTDHADILAVHRP